MTAYDCSLAVSSDRESYNGGVVGWHPVSSSLSTTDIAREWGKLQRLSNADPGVAYIGHVTGQLALRFDPPVDGIHRVLLSAVAAGELGHEQLVYYHPVLHRVTDDGERLQQRTQFRHPLPAHDWLLETVPDFDLLETVYVNEPDEDPTERSQSTPADE